MYVNKEYLEQWRIYKPALLLNIYVESIRTKVLHILFRTKLLLQGSSLRNREKLRLSQGFEPLDQAAERIRQTIDFPAFLKELKNFNGKLFQGCAMIYEPTISKSFFRFILVLQKVLRKRS